VMGVVLIQSRDRREINTRHAHVVGFDLSYDELGVIGDWVDLRAGRLACHPSGRFQLDRYSKYHVSLMCVWGGE